MKTNQQGFTLLELLIVIVIIAILAAIVFVALDPARRFQDARDARRASDIVEVLHAVKIDQVDNRGDYLADIEALTAAEVYMIGTAVAGCDDQNAFCDTNVTADTSCVDLTDLVTEGYLGEVPISPDGDGAWTAAVSGLRLREMQTVPFVSAPAKVKIQLKSPWFDRKNERKRHASPHVFFVPYFYCCGIMTLTYGYFQASKRQKRYAESRGYLSYSAYAGGERNV